VTATSLPAWVPAEETKPAPMPLLLVQSFVNTSEADRATDLLADLGPAREWLTDTGLLTSNGRLNDEDLATARAVRESVRGLLVHNSGGPAPTAVELAPLRTLARASWIQPTLSADGRVQLELEGGGDRLALGRLVVIIRDAQIDGTWDRLKACHNSECSWAFYDRSHARRGAWCDMAVCGNRVKNRNLRSRKAAVAATNSPIT
jgi:predicted RNA-binding Zn ribbon-like protein